MNQTIASPEMTKRVHDLVRSYVEYKTEAKTGKTWKDFKDKKIKDPETGKERVDVPKDYREAKQKICSNAFLRMRSCKTREDFVGFFVGTICSVPQFLPQEEYQQFSTILLKDEQWEEVRALAMLALSALSKV
jgi:CRISPR-associated protein Cmx8